MVRYDGGFGYLAIDSFLATFAPKAKGSAKKGTSKQGSEEKVRGHRTSTTNAITNESLA